MRRSPIHCNPDAERFSTQWSAKKKASTIFGVSEGHPSFTLRGFCASLESTELPEDFPERVDNLGWVIEDLSLQSNKKTLYTLQPKAEKTDEEKSDCVEQLISYMFQTFEGEESLDSYEEPTQPITSEMKEIPVFFQERNVPVYAPKPRAIMDTRGTHPCGCWKSRTCRCVSGGRGRCPCYP